MRPLGWGAALGIAASLFPLGTPLAGQTEGTLGLGASLVEYEGFLASGAVVFAPALRFDSPRLSIAGQGSWTVFESGNRAILGTATAGWLAGSRGPWRLELSGSAGASEYAAEHGAGHLLAGARLHLAAPGGGAWIGAHAGESFGGPAGIPLELAVAGWSVRNRLALVGSVTTTLQGQFRHLDLVGAIRWTGSRMEIEARAGARPWAESPEEESGGSTAAYGEITAVVPLGRRLAVSLAAGKYPSDPVRQLLGAKYLTAGVRLRVLGKPARSVPVHTTGVLGERHVPTETSGPRLEIAGSDEQRTLRVRAPNASSVELMGDFTDWMPVRLSRVAPAVWEITLLVPGGVHRVNLRIDGGPWSVPGGTRLERNEFGGTVGIIVVP